MESLSKTYQVMLVLSVFFKLANNTLIELRQEQGSDQMELVPMFWTEVVVRKE